MDKAGAYAMQGAGSHRWWRVRPAGTQPRQALVEDPEASFPEDWEHEGPTGAAGRSSTEPSREKTQARPQDAAALRS